MATEEATDRATVVKKVDTASIVFGDSMSAALEEAKQTDRRVLVYFTGPSCGWCLVMENKTHSDPIVSELASRFVCVKVDIAKSRGVQEDYGVFSIPRTMVLTPDNELVTDCFGFESPDKHAARLRMAIDSPALTPLTAGASANIVVGASVVAADVVFWFVDALTKEPVKRLSNHSELLSYLRDNGCTARIEHMPRNQFQSRWDAANKREQIPDLLVASNRSGLIWQLMAQGVTRDAISTRLKFKSIPAVCEDFTMLNIWLLPGSVSHVRAEQAMNFLFEPPSDSKSGVRRFASQQSRVEAEQFAGHVAEWAFGGNLAELRKHWDPAAPQQGMTESDDIRWSQSLEVENRGVEIIGNDNLAIALVETRGAGVNEKRQSFVSESAVIGSPTLVILKRDRNLVWRVLMAGSLNYDVRVVEPSRIMQFAWQVAANNELANPKILGPPCRRTAAFGQAVRAVRVGRHQAQ